MRVDYVEFMYPGLIVSDSSLEPSDADAPVTLPPLAFAYRRAWREEVAQDDETLRGTLKYGPTTYFGLVRTLDEIPDIERNRILRSNMKCHGYERVVSTRFGQSFPITADDIVEPDHEVQNPKKLGATT